VERRGGCDHMTCRCGTPFNYSQCVVRNGSTAIVHVSPAAGAAGAKAKARFFPLTPATFEVRRAASSSVASPRLLLIYQTFSVSLPKDAWG
jgi:hypothetical protein